MKDLVSGIETHSYKLSPKKKSLKNRLLENIS